MANHEFTKKELINILDAVIGYTLGEVDKKNVFSKTKNKPKITGIAGDVVEQSILEYPADNEQAADLLVDKIDVELKTTGLKRSKKSKYEFEAKEPMSITAVSPDKIVKEEFYSSTLWNKLENMLLVYYLYDSDTTVVASEYTKFIIQGYQFHSFNSEDIEILLNDWKIVRDFIIDVKNNNKDISLEYPKISKLREKMLYMDTAPKYPNPPRFRLRRNVVTTIAQKHFGKNFELLTGKNRFSSYYELDKILHDFTLEYKNKSINEIATILNLKLNRNKEGNVSKSITEKILTAAFGIKSGKLRNIDTFAKIGTIPKTLTLTKKGGKTEDTKFDTINFEEWTNKEVEFKDSSLYDFFANHTILFSIFEEIYDNSPLEKNIFKGFKRINFDDNFIDTHVKETWDTVRNLIWSKTFKVTTVFDAKGNIIVNKTGVPMEKTNFPKSSKSVIFLRGTSTDSNRKTLEINGYKLYHQQFWIKGKILIEMLSNVNFI